MVSLIRSPPVTVLLFVRLQVFYSRSLPEIKTSSCSSTKCFSRHTGKSAAYCIYVCISSIGFVFFLLENVQAGNTIHANLLYFSAKLVNSIVPSGCSSARFIKLSCLLCLYRFNYQAADECQLRFFSSSVFEGCSPIWSLLNFSYAIRGLPAKTDNIIQATMSVRLLLRLLENFGNAIEACSWVDSISAGKQHRRSLLQ